MTFCAAPRPFPRRSRREGAGTARVLCRVNLSFADLFANLGAHREARFNLPGSSRSAAFNAIRLTLGIRTHAPHRAVLGRSFLQARILIARLPDSPGVAAVRGFVGLVHRCRALGTLENQLSGFRRIEPKALDG